MIDHVALRVHSTRAYTGVPTFVKDTSLVAGAVCVNHAFRATNGVRVTGVTGHAAAGAVVALRVWSTR